MTVDPNDLPRPFGEFTLLRLIAQGGMGAVYLALRPVEEEESRMRHLPSGQEEVCVVKTVRSDLRADREAIGRFLDEARVVQKLAHPRIARTLDAGIIDKTYFLALEFISGRNLRDVHTRAQKLGMMLPEPLIVHVITEMLEALDYAHKLKDPDDNKALNIVHRDVSPHNVMLGFDGNTRLIDFGLASHELKRELTRPGVMVGKLRYNAPEQVRDRALDGRSDVYSAGVCLYEFIANERFYEGLPEEQIWRVAMKGDHRPRSWRDIDKDWRNLLDVALQNDPEKRFRNARDFRMALADVAESKDIELTGMRKIAKAFMTEVFGKEQTQEREMILQATGIAEARTRLFRTPSEMQSAIAAIPKDARSAKDVVRAKTNVVDMATEIVDLNQAAHLLELRDMMSHLAAPDAETALPQDPVVSHSERSAESNVNGEISADMSADMSAEASAVSVRTSDVVRLASEERTHRDATVRLQASDFDDALSDDVSESDDPTYDGPDSKQANVSANDATVQSRKARSMSGPSRRVLDDATAAEAMLPDEPNPVTGSRSMRSPKRSAPLPPLPPKTKPQRNGPIAALIIGLLVVVGIGVAVMIAAPRLVEPDAPLVAPKDGGDGPIPVGQPPPVESPPPPVEAPPVESPPVESPPPPVEANDVDEPEPEPSRKPKRPPPPPPPPAGPPKVVPTTLSGQLGYLKQHCIGRVQCAQAVVNDAANFSAMSPADLKDLKDSVPRCIQKCQRQ